MNRVRKTLYRSVLFSAASVVAFTLVVSCSRNDDSSLPTLVGSNSSGPPTVAVAPTIPADPSPTSARPRPDFAPITPPPLGPSLPSPPDAGNPGAADALARQGILLDQVGFGGYSLRINNLRVRGTIARVGVQFLNTTCNTDITSLIEPTAIAQFVNSLTGRGNRFGDIGAGGGFDFSFTFPYTANGLIATSDGRILIKAFRNFPSAQGEPESRLSGDDVVIVLTITDAFGQSARFESNIFDTSPTAGAGEGRVLTTCGSLASPLRSPGPTPNPTRTPTP